MASDAVRVTSHRSVPARRSFWSNVAAVAYKEASVIRHDKALLATVFAQPVMMFLLFGYGTVEQAGQRQVGWSSIAATARSRGASFRTCR